VALIKKREYGKYPVARITVGMKRTRELWKFSTFFKRAQIF
jgi:hypothetical protein